MRILTSLQSILVKKGLDDGYETNESQVDMFEMDTR